jgi:DNA-binding LacI/PurR family transcriptional regulator
MSEPTTIYDVAKKAGVSISTVSLALNSPARVRPTTLSRVLAAADELAFVPKADAVTRARRGIGRIGVLAPFSSYPSFARRLNGVLRAVKGSSSEIVVYDQESATSSILASLPLTRRLDGLIVMSLPFSDEVANRLVSQQITTVLVEIERHGFSSVTIDDAAGGRMVAEHLLARGHRHLAFIGEEQSSHHYVSQSEARLSGFKEALTAAGCPVAEGSVQLVPHGIEAARAATHKLLAGTPTPTAVFAHDDILAGGALKAAHELGLSVPNELAVVGFDDGELAEQLGLTSVRQPLEDSGEIAAQMLLANLANPGRSARQMTLNLTLVERETT